MISYYKTLYMCTYIQYIYLYMYIFIHTKKKENMSIIHLHLDTEGNTDFLCCTFPRFFLLLTWKDISFLS